MSDPGTGRLPRLLQLRPRRRRRPAGVIVVSFSVLIGIGTVLLMLPAATAGDGRATFGTALFTATSAACVVGLATEVTGTYWSGFGQAVIAGLIQIGGLGITTLAALTSLLVARRLSLRSSALSASETGISRDDVRRVLQVALLANLVTVALLTSALTLRFLTAYDEGFGTALGTGAFLAISAYNNAGFAPAADNLMPYVTDVAIYLPIAIAVVIGGLGAPVLADLARRRPRRRWTLHTRLTLLMTGWLLAIGWVTIAALEWDNPATLGALSGPQAIGAAFFQSVSPRTAGFNTLDYGAMTDGSLLTTVGLMVIGGGSASTAGGLKVTTFAVLLLVALAEIRGDKDITAAGRRRIPDRAVRQALTVATAYVGVLFIATLAMLLLTELALRDALFETASALATVGLSTGVTPDLPAPARDLLVFLMFLGRIGPLTLASSLALRERPQQYRLPEEQPIIG